MWQAPGETTGKRARGDNAAHMPALRHVRFLARLILAWFVASLGAAVAAPLVHPQRIEWVCSAGGEPRWVVAGAGEDAAVPAHHGLECPLCLPTVLPPPPSRAGAPVQPPLTHLPALRYRAPLATPAGAPFPPRAPPLPA